ncbi:VWA domain-containing protein [Geothermobacter hydrogeniphilus]|uniref:VWA domain-containing protein n=1 Tax=Geothermobacter hydrogeniphilus TaxID=1969733 RepID=A0A2K2HCJ4_9BACT|nr:VWA domain-containing protein [Geothermobacter hydrogeniphilus]PNU21025.1 VWA domain-containing protein [Geothermobacter hydrogeniphilus]
MLVDFFLQLKQAKIPVTIREYLGLLEALDKQVVWGNVEDFYYLARLCLVKDETHFDKFDRVFAQYFDGIENLGEELEAEIPEEWLRRLSELILSEEEKAQIEALGGFEKLMETLKKRLAEQQERHQGGNRWIGTAGRSPFGAYGYNPEGIRIGQHESRHRRAVKVWDRREFKNLDDSVELGTRNIKLALRRLRHFTRDGAPEVLDLPATIRATADNAGCLDLQLVPERHNKVKVLLFFDVGGSMDEHIRVCEELFSAARSEFKNLEYFYFHNFIYESVWRDNQRYRAERIDLHDLINTYGSDYKLIFVGDAAMSPYEISMVGGSVEHYNDEAGYIWCQRLLDAYPDAIWLNPTPHGWWHFTQSIGMVRQIMDKRMFPLTLEGLEQGIRLLSRSVG